jgi:uncharacterized protein with GYD domain
MVPTPEGFKGLVKEGGSQRIEAAKQALGSVGGPLEAFYFFPSVKTTFTSLLICLII